jgi:hypothetical protein
MERGFRRLGWDGPLAGGKHKFMKKGARKYPLPHTPVGRDKLKDILEGAGISEEEWMKVI